jgi:acyl dehydratase
MEVRRIMLSDYAELEPGQEISRHSYQVDEGIVADYVTAVQDENPALMDESGERLVPPMAVAALSIRGVVQDLRIPGGTLHAGQEFEFMSSVYIGRSLECVATLSQNSIRGDWRFLVIDCRVTDGERSDVMIGKSTIMVPAGLGPREDG